MDVIVVAGNWMMSGSIHDVSSAIDVPELRILAHRGTIDFHYSDVTDERIVPKLREMEAELGISDVWPPYIVILDGRRKPVEVLRFQGNRDAVVARIIAAM